MIKDLAAHTGNQYSDRDLKCEAVIKHPAYAKGKNLNEKGKLSTSSDSKTSSTKRSDQPAKIKVLKELAIMVEQSSKDRKAMAEEQRLREEATAEERNNRRVIQAVKTG